MKAEAGGPVRGVCGKLGSANVVWLVMLLAQPLISQADLVTLVPEQVKPAVVDKQDFQIPDRVHLHGWIGTRVAVNESNRLAKLEPARLLEGYRHRPGRQTWDGEHVGKWLHAATLAWVNTGDAKLRANLDYTVAELCKCQLPDGYLGTYAETNRWTQWDVWAHKYNLIGLVTYMRYTKNLSSLPTCRRMADLLCRTFGDEAGKLDIVLAGQHMGMAPTSVLEPMVLLYRLTGEPRYRDFCKYILRAWEQPNGPKIISTLLTSKRVDKVGNGKAYEMLSCLNGALEFYRTGGDAKILEACLNAWNDIVEHRLYLTGAASYREFFHDDFDLPNVNNVGETCVTVTWLQFNAQLLRLTGEARFAEQLEKVVLNQLFGAECPDGSAWGYYVQMQGKKPYSSTLDGHCCLSSGPRGISLIPSFALTTDADGIVVNLYEAEHASLNLRDGPAIDVRVETRYPSDDEITVGLAPAAARTFALKLRIPTWCPSPVLQVNGQEAKPAANADGYVAIRREWKTGDEVRLQLKLEPRVLIGDHKNEGRLAVLYGPLVLAADEALLEAKSCALNNLGVPSANLTALRVTPEPAPSTLKTWPGAQVFSLEAVARHLPDLEAQGTPFKTRLVPFADAGATGSSYKIWLPFEPRRPDRNLLIDGIEVRSRKPNAGSIIDNNLETIASTFNSRRAPLDWFGVELPEAVTVSRVVFAHGKTFHDGGWFDAGVGKPRVEVRFTADGPWTAIGALADYPATSATDAAGLKAGERFVYKVAKPVKVFGVRVAGKPTSGDSPKQAFSSCAELEAFGN